MAHGSPPHGFADVVKYFGDPRMISGKVDARWEQSNMVLIRDADMLPAGKLYVHRKIVEPLTAALTKSSEIGWRPKTIGCFAPRMKRGATGISLHTFGAAVDVDAATNPLIERCPAGDPRRVAPASRDIPDDVIDIWRAEGWIWGGDFSGRFDPMHFQWASGC